jgi:NADH-quinone oxidoreductase subunit G
MLVKLMRHLGVKNIDILQHLMPGDEDNILVRADKTPNSTGARTVGIDPGIDANLHSITKDISSGVIKAFYVLEDDIANSPEFSKVSSKLDFLIVHASNENTITSQADVVLPCSTYAEKHGTFTNFEGRVQRIRPAVATVEQDRSLDGFSMSRLDKFGAHNDRWMKGAKRDARPSWRILMNVANALGAKWKYASAQDVFDELAAQHEAFKGMSYARIGSRGMMLRTRTPASATVRQ